MFFRDIKFYTIEKQNFYQINYFKLGKVVQF